MKTHTPLNSAQFEIEFSTRGKQPQCLPDLRFPEGVDLDSTTSTDEPACKVELPYPARCIGCWMVHCRKCGVTILITAAGRFDDPRSVKIPCKRST